MPRSRVRRWLHPRGRTVVRRPREVPTSSSGFCVALRPIRWYGRQVLRDARATRPDVSPLVAEQGMNLVDDCRAHGSKHRAAGSTHEKMWSDSGVVTSTWGGVRAMRARSCDGVSPERTDTRISGRLSSSARISPIGPRRFFWTSLASARSGDTYSTVVPSLTLAKSRSTDDRNAASVLPEPVGAAIRTLLPVPDEGPSFCCGGLGAPRRSENQR